ncbi:MAG: carotenoid biosynthesis protein [Anaerolineaceae bacterium]|nr:carotenoid biosynthesis protein [Anaerolineaceae bacterium]
MNPQFLIFEVLIYILFIACLRRATQQGASRVSELVFGVLYGVFLEWMTIQQLSAYHYGQFLIMIDGAPLCIGLAWSVIIFSGMEYVKQLDIPGVARPFLIGFLALNMDLACDVIAIRQGFWTWAIPLDAQWFGVPWGNFWAWYIVVVSYSGMLYVFQTRKWRISKNALKRWGYVPLATFISIIILAITNYLFVYEFGTNGISGLLSMGFLLQAGALIVIIFRPKVPDTAKIDQLSMAVPLVFHLYFNWIGFQNGYYFEIPILGFVGMLMLFIGLFIHLYPYWKAKRIQRLSFD